MLASTVATLARLAKVGFGDLPHTPDTDSLRHCFCIVIEVLECHCMLLIFLSHCKSSLCFNLITVADNLEIEKEEGNKMPPAPLPFIYELS